MSGLDKAAAALLLASGFIVMGIGAYFIFVRAPLLPEDFRFIGASAEAARASLPGLARWLGKVFMVMGGYILAAGVLTAYLGVLLLRMSAVNFIIDSDYKWFLFAVALLWAGALLTHWVSRLRSHPPSGGPL